jgi:hypothetical protein
MADPAGRFKQCQSNRRELSSEPHPARVRGLLKIEMQATHRRGYGTPVTLIDDEAAAEAADARQAAYFRTSLNDERERLRSEIAKRRDYIAHRNSTTSVTARLRSDLRGVEAQLHYLEGMIARLDRRFH